MDSTKPGSLKPKRCRRRGGCGAWRADAAFEAFKDANDERLDEIERRMSADVVTATRSSASTTRSTASRRSSTS